MSRKKDRETEQSLIRWRRKQVAEMWFSGEDVKTIAEKLKVSPRTIYDDQEYIENHADDLMKNYIVKTVPFMISRSIYQINMANQIVAKIANDPESDKKEKISAALAAAKTAKDVVDVVAGNKGVIEKALELDESLKESVTLDELLPGYDSETEAETKDPNRLF